MQTLDCKRIRVTSLDGTQLTARIIGCGDTLLLVHGTSVDGDRWVATARSLSTRFRVVMVDRRGRGESGDGPDYAIEREAEDIACVVAALGPGVTVLGHSFGGLCAMEAALCGAHLRGLILYEPPVSMTPRPVSTVVPELEQLLACGDRDAVVATFFRKHIGASAEMVATLRAHPAWGSRLMSAHTIAREMRAAAGYQVQPERLAKLGAPALLLAGTMTPEPIRAANKFLAGLLRGAQFEQIEGQGHMAMDTAPRAFCAHVTAFVDRALSEVASVQGR